MGWGQDHTWATAVQDNDGLAGVVDSVTVRHLGKVAEDYDVEAAQAALATARAVHPEHDMRSVRRRGAAWRMPWRSPPWVLLRP